MRKALWIAAIIGVVAACGVGIRAHAAPAADAIQAGATAPNFTLPSQEDKPVSLTDYKGKWVVLPTTKSSMPTVSPSRTTAS
jgi:peroxiredoxin Q/BCP